MGEGAVKSHGAGAKHVANMTQSKQLTRTTNSVSTFFMQPTMDNLLLAITFIVRTIKCLVKTLYNSVSMVLDFFKDGLEKHGNGMEFYTGSSVRTLLLLNLPLVVCECRSCYSRLSAWLHTGSIQFDKLARKCQWRAMRMDIS